MASPLKGTNIQSSHASWKQNCWMGAVRADCSRGGSIDFGYAAECSTVHTGTLRSPLKNSGLLQIFFCGWCPRFDSGPCHHFQSWPAAALCRCLRPKRRHSGAQGMGEGHPLAPRRLLPASLAIFRRPRRGDLGSDRGSSAAYRILQFPAPEPPHPTSARSDASR
jgi:hypothetical protein